MSAELETHTPSPASRIERGAGLEGALNSEIERTGGRLWSLANATAVFSAAQFATLIFAMAGEEFRRSVAAAGVRPAIVVIVVLLTVGQLLVIGWCSRRLAELERSRAPVINHIASSIARGRIITIVLFALLSILVLFIAPFSAWISKLFLPQ